MAIERLQFEEGRPVPDGPKVFEALGVIINCNPYAFEAVEVGTHDITPTVGGDAAKRQREVVVFENGEGLYVEHSLRIPTIAAVINQSSTHKLSTTPVKVMTGRSSLNPNSAFVAVVDSHPVKAGLHLYDLLRYVPEV
jgi:hypothetical protein